jgi:hypothetical protein
MDDLALVGVHDDGEHVVLTAPEGRRYRLRVDDALRAAVRRDRARLGQLQIEMDGRLRPRDIQARIRGGQTAEEIADEFGVPLAYVRRYEGPVLAEREYITSQARAVSVRRCVGESPLGELVGERLAAGAVNASTVEWDAWRADDGSWVVAVRFGADRQTARWAYDPTIRQVTALDDQARTLMRDDDAPETGTSRRSGPARAAELGHDWIGVIDPPPPVDLLDTLRERRGRRTRPLLPDDEGLDEDPVREAIDSLRARRDPGEAEVPPGLSLAGPPYDGGDDEHDRSAGRGRRGHGRRAGSEVVLLPEPEPVPVMQGAPAEGPEADAEHPSAGADAQRGSRKSRRASVPSWDDIVFGARRE